jgi:hypothetical protein
MSWRRLRRRLRSRYEFGSFPLLPSINCLGTALAQRGFPLVAASVLPCL